MKILVTVGTTAFDSLIKYIDKEEVFLSLDIEFQIANGKYIPSNHPYFCFVDSNEIMAKYNLADIIISHAGFGTVTQLLEMGKRLIVVPNLERVDKHQLDISAHLTKNRYALVAYDFNQIPMFIDLCADFRFKKFSKNNFFKADEIRSFLLDNTSK